MKIFQYISLIAVLGSVFASDAFEKSVECEECSKVFAKRKKDILEPYFTERNELNLKLIFTDIPTCVVSYEQSDDFEILSESCVEKVSETCHHQNITVKISKGLIKCKNLFPSVEPKDIIEDTMQPIFDIITNLFPKCGRDLNDPVKPNMDSVQQCIAKKFAENPTEDKSTKGNVIFNVEDVKITLRLNFSVIDDNKKLNGYDILPTAANLVSAGCDPDDSSSFGNICQCLKQEKLLDYQFGISIGRINCFGRIVEDLPLDKVNCLNSKNV